MGIEISCFLTLLFANDQVLIATDEEDIYMTRKIIDKYREWGMNININKTEYLIIGEKLNSRQRNYQQD